MEATIIKRYEKKIANLIATINDFISGIGFLVENKARWINRDIVHCNDGTLMS